LHKIIYPIEEKGATISGLFFLGYLWKKVSS